MRYTVTGDFIKINETAGTIQNTSRIYPVEVSNKSEANSGILLYPLNKFSFSGTPIYLRCMEGGCAEILVVPFIVNAGSGGGSAVSADVPQTFDAQDLNDIFKE